VIPLHVVWCAIGFLVGSFCTFVLIPRRPADPSFEFRCRECGRIWDEHTAMGVCPDGSGRQYRGPHNWGV